MPYGPARFSLFAAALLWLSAVACTDPSPTAAVSGNLSLDRAGTEPGTHRQYGTPIKLGQGRARSYVVLNKGVPVEVGVALDETALEGLRAPMPPMDDMRPFVRFAAFGALCTTLACASTSTSSTTSTSIGVGATTLAGGARVACATALVGITLPPGFCATVFADSLGPARHMAVAPNGDVFVAIGNRADPRRRCGAA